MYRCGTDIMPNIFQSYETAERGMLKKSQEILKQINYVFS